MKRLLRSLAIAGFAAMNIMLLSVSVWAGNVTDITPETRDFFHWFSALIALPAAAFAGQPFFSSALKALRNRRTNMDVPISIGVCLALGVSLYETAISAEHAYFDSAIMLLFFLLAGRTLDQVMRRKTRALAGNLAALKAETAERIDADGTLTHGAGGGARDRRHDPRQARRADRRRRHGRSPARRRSTRAWSPARRRRGSVANGDPVYAGTINQGGALTVAVSAAGRRLAHRRGAEAARQGDRGALAAPAARRPGGASSTRRSCT